MEDKESSERPTLRKLSPIPLPQAQPFRLMDLPDELWVRIGKMLIEDTTAIEVSHIGLATKAAVRLGDGEDDRDRLARGWVHSFELTPPAILQTCGALRKELRAEYYRTKITILLKRRRGFGQYLRMIGPDARKMIQTTYSDFVLRKTQVKLRKPPTWAFNDWEMEMMWTPVRKPYHPGWDGDERGVVEWQIKFL